MAEAIAFCLAWKIIKSLGSMAFKEIGSMWGVYSVEDELEKLKDTVSAVHAVLLDAEEQQYKSHRVKHWIKKLGDAVYDADDLLTEFYTEDLRRRVMDGDKMVKKVRTFCSSSNQLSFRHDMAKKLIAVRERFDAMANEMI